MSLRAEAEATTSSSSSAPAQPLVGRGGSIVYKGAARFTTSRITMSGLHPRQEAGGGGGGMSPTTSMPASAINRHHLDVSPPALNRADGTSPPSSASSPTDMLSAGCRRDFLTQLRRKHQTSASHHQHLTSSTTFGGGSGESDADMLASLKRSNGGGGDTASTVVGASSGGSSSFVHPALLLSSYPLYYQRSSSSHSTTTTSSSESMSELAPLLCPPPSASTSTPPVFLGTAIAVSPRILITTAHHYHSHKDDVGGFLVRLPHTLQVEHYLRRTLGSDDGEKNDSNSSSSTHHHPTIPNIDASQTTVLIRVLYAQKKLDLDMCVLWLEESVPFFLSHEQFRSFQPFGSRFGGGDPSPPSSLPSSSTTATDSLSAAMDDLYTTTPSTAATPATTPGVLPDEPNSSSLQPLIVPGPQSEVRATTVYYQPQYAQDVLSGYYELYHSCIAKADADLESHHLALKAAAAQLAAAAKKRNATSKKAPQPRGGGGSKKIPAYTSKKKVIMVEDLVKEDTQSAAQIFLGSPERRVSQHQWVCSVVDAWSTSISTNDEGNTTIAKRGGRRVAKGVVPLPASSELMRNVARLESKRVANRHMVVGTHRLSKYLNCWEPVVGDSDIIQRHHDAEIEEDNAVFQNTKNHHQSAPTPHKEATQHKDNCNVANGTIILFRLLPPHTKAPTYLARTPHQPSYPLTTNALRIFLKHHSPHHLYNHHHHANSSSLIDNGSISSDVEWEAHLSALLCRDARIVSSTGSIVEAIGRGGGGGASASAAIASLPRVAPHSCVVKGTITTFGSSGAPVVDTRTGRMLLGMHVASNASKSHHHATDKNHHHNNISSNTNGIGATTVPSTTTTTSSIVMAATTTRTSEFIMTSALIRALHILEVYLHPLNPNLQ